MQTYHDSPVDQKIFSHETATVANPGAGNPADFPCPVNARVRITTVQFDLTAILGSSQPLYSILTAGGDLLTYAVSALAGVGFATTQVNASAGIYHTWLYATPEQISVPLPTNIIMEPGDTFRLDLTTPGPSQEIENIALSYDQWIIA